MSGAPTDKPKARELNDTIRYTMWSVFRVRDVSPTPTATRSPARSRTCSSRWPRRTSSSAACTTSPACAPTPTACSGGTRRPRTTLQEAYSRFRRTALGRASSRSGRSMALHRPAEFNKSHIPAFLAGEEPRDYVCVYPFVRSYEWYLLPDEERRAHARRARQDGARLPRRARQHGGRRSRSATTSGSSPSRPTSCTASSTSCATCAPRRARMHVREEVPFYTGSRKPVTELVAALP